MVTAGMSEKIARPDEKMFMPNENGEGEYDCFGLCHGSWNICGWVDEKERDNGRGISRARAISGNARRLSCLNNSILVCLADWSKKILSPSSFRVRTNMIGEKGNRKLTP